METCVLVLLSRLWCMIEKHVRIYAQLPEESERQPLLFIGILFHSLFFCLFLCAFRCFGDLCGSCGNLVVGE